MKKKQGFTLTEVMMVVFITGLLAAMSMPSMRNARDRAHRNACQSNLRTLNAATQEYLFVNPAVPSLSTTDLLTYFLNEQAPECPSGGEYTVYINPRIIPTCSFADDKGHKIDLGD